MITIDLEKIREALPDRAVVKLLRYNGHTVGKGSPAIRCFINKESLSDKDFEMCKEWQRKIIGDAILEFYTEETGRDWFIYLKRIPIHFINAEDEDVNSFNGLNLITEGELKNTISKRND